jgi:hypothetical protein
LGGIGWEIFMAQFEVQYFDKDNWEDVSEDTVLELIQKNFVRVTQITNDLLQGKTLLSSKGFYRVKKENKI